MRRRSRLQSRGSISRAKAAEMLRAARAAFRRDVAHAGESIGWAFTVLRDSKASRKLKIDYLIRTGQFDSADALIARSIMQQDDHPLMRLRFAESLFGQGRVAQANEEINRVLNARPECCRALCLAAQIADAMQNHAAAVARLNVALELKPCDAPMRRLLIECLVKTNDVEQAAWHLDRWQDAPVALKARVWRAQQRHRDALELLESAIAAASDVADASAVESMIEYVDLLQAVGDHPRLRRMVPLFAAWPAPVRIRAARALIAAGEFEAARSELCAAAEDPAWRDRVAPSLLVAEMHCGNSPIMACAEYSSLKSAAERTWDDATPPSDIHKNARPIVPAARSREMASLWLSAMFGDITTTRIDPRQFSADPSTSLLAPMLLDAVRTFDAALASMELDAPQREAIERHRAACAQATMPLALSHEQILDGEAQASSMRHASDDRATRRAA